MSVVEKVIFGAKALTPQEDALFARACAWVGPALQRHGVGLTAKEIRYVGAETVDFVLSEIQADRKNSGKEK